MRTAAVLLTTAVAILMAVVPARTQAQWRSVPAPGDGLTAVSAVARWDTWAVNGPTLYHHDHRGWRFRRSITGVSFADINLDSASDGWAVGSEGAAAFALHRTDDGWRPTALPPTTDAPSAFSAVDVLSPADAWAVGSAGAATLAEHWDGARWSIVPTPVLPGPATLRGVAIAAASDVWAVGDYTDPDAFDHGRIPLIEHWDGSGWTRVATHITPDYSDGYQDYFLRDVGVAGGRAWVVGDQQAYHVDRALVERWNGIRWTNLLVPLDFGASGHCTARPLETVSAVSATNVWTFGRCSDPFENTFTEEATALHFASGVWSWVTMPAPAPSSQQAAYGSTTTPGTSRVWAVGTSSIIDDQGNILAGPNSLALFGP